MIPRIAHFIWLYEDPPDWVKQNIEQFRAHHQGWTTILWRDTPSNFPPDLHKLMRQLPFMASKSDIFRYWLMAQYGGLYLDCDNFVIKNFEPLLQNQFFTAPYHEKLVACGLLGSEPESYPAQRILSMCRMIAENDPDKRDRKTFGPDLMTPLCWGLRDCTMLPQHYFYALPDRPSAQTFWLSNQAGRDIIMAEIKNRFVDGVTPYSVHLWGVNESSTRREESLPDATSHYQLSRRDALVATLSGELDEPEVARVHMPHC